MVGGGRARTCPSLSRVEERRGGLGRVASLRFPSHRVAGGGHPSDTGLTERWCRFLAGRALRVGLVVFLTLIAVAIGSGIYVLNDQLWRSSEVQS